MNKNEIFMVQILNFLSSLLMMKYKWFVNFTNVHEISKLRWVTFKDALSGFTIQDIQ